MKKILLSVALCMLVGFSFAQKNAVKEAKAAMSSNNLKEARAIISPAQTDPETATDPETWKVVADIEYTAFENEKNNELFKQPVNQDVMYESLMASYDPYVTADSLAQIPNDKGKIKNKYRKDIISKLKAAHNYFYNGGVFYSQKSDNSKAADFFTKYWDLPYLSIFEDDKEKINTNDSIFQIVKYYAVVSSLKAEEHERAVKLLNRIKSEPFIDNSVYSESDVYEFLAAEYQTLGDQTNLVLTLEEGASKFPNNKYFIPKLVNQYIQDGQSDKAMLYLDKAIANNPASSCEMNSVKASLYAEKQNFEEADNIYQQVLAKDPDCERALEGLSVSYIVQAQNINDEAGKIASIKDRTALEDKAKQLYTKSYPLLEKYKSLLIARSADDELLKGALVKLQNVYYNLKMNDEFDAITQQLESYAVPAN